MCLFKSYGIDFTYKPYVSNDTGLSILQRIRVSRLINEATFTLYKIGGSLVRLATTNDNINELSLYY